MANIEIFTTDGTLVWDNETAKPGDSPDGYMAQHPGQTFKVKIVSRGMKWSGELTADGPE